MHPGPVQHAGWAYLARGCGVIFDAGSLIYGLRQFRRQNRDKRFWEATRQTKNPGSLMVVVEDSAACVGDFRRRGRRGTPPSAETAISIAATGGLHQN